MKEERVFYRAGSSEEPLGQYFSLERPYSEFQVRVDKAVLPTWPQGGVSKIDTGFGIKIPKGTVIHVGEISSQGGIFLGGTQQILIETPWKLKGVEVVEQFALKQEAIWQHMMQ